MMKEPEINVGIVNAQEIHFSLNGRFFCQRRNRMWRTKRLFQ